MKVDNSSAIQLVKNPKLDQHIQSGFLPLDYVPSLEQMADGLTKPLPACQKMRDEFRMAARRNSANIRVPKVSAFLCELLTLMVDLCLVVLVSLHLHKSCGDL